MRGRVPKSSTVFTPSALSAAMVRAARGVANCDWLDPCVGSGAFVKAMAACGVSRDHILAFDLDRQRNVFDRLGVTNRGVDFIAWAANHRSSVDRVVMNPPFVALSRLTGSPLRHALEVMMSDGRSLPLKSNYWCAFVLRATECLRPDGALVTVLPASWEYARYAEPIREVVERSFGSVVVLRCRTPLFPNVRDGSVVVIATRRGSQPSVVRRLEVADLAGTVGALDGLARGSLPRGGVVIRGVVKRKAPTRRLDEVISIRIGAVTGDVKYFLLTDCERRQLRLPTTAVRPVISRSRDLNGAYVGRREWLRLRDQDARVWLFRPSSTACKHAAVVSYLAKGVLGECNRAAYKIRSRDVWYRTPLPSRIDGFISGMSKRLPFLVLRGMTGLSASNTLYVISFKDKRGRVERAALGVVLLTTAVRMELARRVRHYADGLLKFEPSELGAIRIPIVTPRRNAVSVFKHATALLISGNVVESEALANRWVESCLKRRSTSFESPNRSGGRLKVMSDALRRGRPRLKAGVGRSPSGFVQRSSRAASA